MFCFLFELFPSFGAGVVGGGMDRKQADMVPGVAHTQHLGHGHRGEGTKERLLSFGGGCQTSKGK